MAKKWTHTAAFARFGTKPKNIRWAWSAKNQKTKTVVVTLGQDRIKSRDGHLIYDWPAADPGSPDTRAAFRELMDNLAWAREHCGGRFNVIMAIAKDTTSKPRSIMKSFPSNIIMRLTHLDITRGAFSSESVDV